MLEIINNLIPFFADCYRELGVREYAREIGISPPSASQKLKYLEKKGLLKKRKERGFLLFRTNRESGVLRNLSRIYWEKKLTSLVEYLKKRLHSDSIVLFGSLAHLEVGDRSDIDIAVFTKFKISVDLNNFSKLLKKDIHIFTFDSLEKVNKELKVGICNGHILDGVLR